MLNTYKLEAVILDHFGLSVTHSTLMAALQNAGFVVRSMRLESSNARTDVGPLESTTVNGVTQELFGTATVHRTGVPIPEWEDSSETAESD